MTNRDGIFSPRKGAFLHLRCCLFLIVLTSAVVKSLGLMRVNQQQT